MNVGAVLAFFQMVFNTQSVNSSQFAKAPAAEGRRKLLGFQKSLDIWRISMIGNVAGSFLSTHDWYGPFAYLQKTRMHVCRNAKDEGQKGWRAAFCWATPYSKVGWCWVHAHPSC